MIKIIECNKQNIIFYYTVHFFSNKQILYFLTITNLKIIDDSIINVKC